MANHDGDNAVYTDSALRERPKAEIIAGGRGGRSGQQSAREAQLLACAYEEAGGGYTTEQGTEDQEELAEWTEEEWTTRDGEPAIRGEETARYLPKEAWERLTPAQQWATDTKKREGSRHDEQFVANTGPACEARKEVSAEHAHDLDTQVRRRRPG